MKEVIICGVISDGFADAFDTCNRDDGVIRGGKIVREWLARMNTKIFGLGITYEAPCCCGHSRNAHNGREDAFCTEFVSDRTAAYSVFRIGGAEAIPWVALEELVRGLKLVGADVERASARDTEDGGEDAPWRQIGEQT